MTFEKSFENYVQILSEEEVTPEISPGALSDVAKDFSLRSIVAIVSNVKEAEDAATEPDSVIPLFGPVPEKEAPAYLFKHVMAKRKLVTYNVYLYGDKPWSDDEYNAFSVIIDILSFHLERFL